MKQHTLNHGILLVVLLLFLASCTTKEEPVSDEWQPITSPSLEEHLLEQEHELADRNLKKNSEIVGNSPEVERKEIPPAEGTADYPIIRQTVFGNYSYFAIKTDGTLWAWGKGNTIYEPHMVMTDVVSIDAGGSVTGAIRTDGSLWMWGSGGSGAVGNGLYDEDVDDPVKVLENVKQIQTTNGQTGAVNKNNELLRWGTNYLGQLGLGANVKTYGFDSRTGLPDENQPDAKTADYSVNKPYKAASDTLYLELSSFNSYSIQKDGSLWLSGSLIGGKMPNLDPNFVQGAVYQPLPGKKINRIYDSGYGVIVIDDQDQLYTWGEYIGSSSMVDKIMDNVKSAAVGQHSGYAIKNDGTLWSWGNPSNRGYLDNRINPYDGALGSGFYGDGDFMEGDTPKMIMEDVENVYAAANKAFAVKTDGTLWAWGKNYYGDLGLPGGLGTGNLYVYEPEYVTDNVHSVYLYTDTALILKKDGTLWEVGDISYRTGYTEFKYTSEPFLVLEDVALPDDPFPLEIE